MTTLFTGSRVGQSAQLALRVADMIRWGILLVAYGAYDGVGIGADISAMSKFPTEDAKLHCMAEWPAPNEGAICAHVVGHALTAKGNNC